MSDLIHCARCRVHWDADGGKPLMELNRILRPGGFLFGLLHQLTVQMKEIRMSRTWPKLLIHLVLDWLFIRSLFHLPATNNATKTIHLCVTQMTEAKYVPLEICLAPLPVAGTGSPYSWPAPWPKRLTSKPLGLSAERDAEEIFYDDTKHWSALVSDVYLEGLAINWSSLRNVMDMNSGFGGFAAVLIDLPLWVMNVIPVNEPDSLSAIFDRGLIGVYHDWCESFNTYPRTYDLLHSSFLFKNLTQRREIVDVAVEMDRILKPGGYVLVQDTVEMINNLSPIFRSLHWSITLCQEQFLVKVFGVWKEKSRYEEKAPYFPV
ncbi:probable methyltransferase PMT23 [Actinidia eriantha]|uniref:probable methyltransferase PMT23 n=1 Tax=Actinidia eriantha TaxID=165200 RepID=UPI00258A12B8|nr:probable methyltransferase PMT23 [Actinidia eriantha]